MLAAETTETISAADISSRVDTYIFRNNARVPITAQLATRDHGERSSSGRAGLPMTLERAATSRTTTAPGSTMAPAPIRTPLRIVALGPIQTSSSIKTGHAQKAGRGAPPPSGE